MRYIIAYKVSEHLITYAAEIADTPQEAASQFQQKHPDKTISEIKPAQDAHQAFESYGMGAWTDEERAQHNSVLDQQYANLRSEHEKAREYVSAYSLEEFAAEQDYRARRASEETPNAEGVHVGDIFYSCWGYGQTNYNFYQVVALRGKHTAVIRENTCKAEMCRDYSGYKRPIRDEFINEATYTMRTSYNDYYNQPQMRVPVLSGRHYMTPITFGKLYSHSTGA